MLNIFNRTEVFITYAKANADKVMLMFDKHGIEYTMRTTTVEDEYTDEIIRDKNKKAFDLSVAYKIYVQRTNADEAQLLVHKALFEEMS